MGPRQGTLAVVFLYSGMMDFAIRESGFETTAVLLAMCILVVVAMTVGLYGWGRWF